MDKWVFVARWAEERKTFGCVYPAHWSYSLHSRKCYEYTRELLRNLRKWTARWPNYCVKCGAQGVVTWSENQSPLGSGEYWPMAMSDLCSCICPPSIEETTCPRCGTNLYEVICATYEVPEGEKWMLEEYGEDAIIEVWLEEEEPCPECGWNWGKNKGDFAPPLPDYDPCWTEDLNTQRPRLSNWQITLFEWLGEWTQAFFSTPIVVLEGKES